jgi:hypothetical protein
MEQFRNYCENLLKKFTLRKVRTKTHKILNANGCKKLTFSGQKAFILLNHFYSDNKISLDRKQESFEEIFKKFNIYYTE